jgi:hypothetical protein
MPQETHTQSLHMPPEWFVAVDFEPFGNCFSTTDYDCAGESTCSQRPVGHMRQAHKGVPCPAPADGAHIQGPVCCVAESGALAAKIAGLIHIGVSPARCVSKHTYHVIWVLGC